MVGVTIVYQREARSVGVHAVEVTVVDVLAGLATHAADKNDTAGRIDLDDLVGPPRTRRERALECAVVVVEVVMAPAGALGPPDDVTARLRVSHRLGLEVRALDGLRDQRPDGIAREVQLDQLEVALGAIASDEPQLVRARRRSE